MALSEREQKVLEQLEELMSNEDPNFASSMSSTGNTAPVFSARQLALGILCVLIGLGIIIGAVASHLIWLGVLGFLFAAFGVYFASTSKKTPVDSFLGGRAEGALGLYEPPGGALGRAQQRSELKPADGPGQQVSDRRYRGENTGVKIPG